MFQHMVGYFKNSVGKTKNHKFYKNFDVRKLSVSCKSKKKKSMDDHWHNKQMFYGVRQEMK